MTKRKKRKDNSKVEEYTFSCVSVHLLQQLTNGEVDYDLIEVYENEILSHNFCSTFDIVHHRSNPSQYRRTD